MVLAQDLDREAVVVHQKDILVRFRVLLFAAYHDRGHLHEEVYREVQEDLCPGLVRVHQDKVESFSSIIVW